MADVDYDALAQQFGGKPVDYDALAKQFGGQSVAAPKEKKLNASPGASIMDAGLSMATGAAGTVLGGLAGIGATVNNALGLSNIAPADAVSSVADTLTWQPRTQGGEKITKALGYIPGKIAEAADWAGARVTDLTGSPVAGATVNTAIQSLPSMANRLNPRISSVLARETAELEKQRALNAPRDAAIDTAKSQGMTIAPAEANPSLLNRILEGGAGQGKVQQLASEKNQPIAQSIVRKGLGIPEDVPLGIDAIEKVRKDAGASYEKIRNAGRIVADEKYPMELDSIVAKYTGAEKDFPKMAKDDIRAAVDSARVDSFDASSGIDAIKIQREAANKAFRAGDNELGKAHKAIADAIEGQIDRGIGATNTQAVKDFRDARSLIARSYDVQKALKGDKVDVRILADQLAKGRPLSGVIKDLAEVYQQFPKSLQLNKSTVTPSPWEMAGALGAGGLGAFSHYAGGGTPTIMGAAATGALAARPVVRSAVTSGPGQSMMVSKPDYIPSLGMRLSDALTADVLPGIVLSAVAADKSLDNKTTNQRVQAVINSLVDQIPGPAPRLQDAIPR